MKAGSFIIFFSIVLSVYGLVYYYIFRHGLQALELLPGLKPWYIGICTFSASAYLIARFLQRIYPSVLVDVMTWVGSFWIAAMVYFLVAVLLIDLVRLIIYFIPGFSLSSLPGYLHLKAWLMAGIIGLVGLVLVVGHYFAVHPRIVNLDLTINKKAGTRKSLNAVMVSDVHFGTIIGKNRVTKLVNQLNSLHPDIILFAGDLVDEDLGPVIRQNLGENLTNLKAPLGVWAITGNHEYIGGAEPAVKYLQDHGIRFLRDEVVLVDSSFFLAGREDRDSKRFSSVKRLSVEELLAKADLSYPVILMDHQPFELGKAAAAGADLQLSGHTHNGQFWPFNYITNAIFEVSHGYKKIGNTHFYVSTGYGSWGPPVRLGARPEIVQLKLHFGE